MLLKWQIKCERKCAGAGFPLQKYFCKGTRMDVVGPMNKGAPVSVKNIKLLLDLSIFFFIVFSNYR